MINTKVRRITLVCFIFVLISTSPFYCGDTNSASQGFASNRARLTSDAGASSREPSAESRCSVHSAHSAGPAIGTAAYGRIHGTTPRPEDEAQEVKSMSSGNGESVYDSESGSDVEEAGAASSVQTIELASSGQTIGAASSGQPTASTHTIEETPAASPSTLPSRGSTEATQLARSMQFTSIAEHRVWRDGLPEGNTPQEEQPQPPEETRVATWYRGFCQGFSAFYQQHIARSALLTRNTTFRSGRYTEFGDDMPGRQPAPQPDDETTQEGQPLLCNNTARCRQHANRTRTAMSELGKILKCCSRRRPAGALSQDPMDQQV